MDLNQYLRFLRMTTPDDTTWEGPGADVVAARWADLTHATAAFVEAARNAPEVGYAEATRELEDILGLFPLEEEPAPPVSIAQRLSEWLGGKFVQVAPGVFTRAPEQEPTAGKAEALTEAEIAAVTAALLKLPTAEDPFDGKKVV